MFKHLPIVVFPETSKEWAPDVSCEEVRQNKNKSLTKPAHTKRPGSSKGQFWYNFDKSFMIKKKNETWEGKKSQVRSL